jgi:hypothetical protein
MADTLPALVRDRPDSADFASYVRHAMLDPFRADIRALFEESALEAAGFIDGDVVRGECATDAPSFHFPNLIALELWMRGVQQS